MKIIREGVEQMRTYRYINTNKLMTFDQVRERFYKLAQERPEEYDSVSFNEYLHNVLITKRELEVVNMWYLVVGHNCDNKGTLIYKFFSEYSDAENYIKAKMCDGNVEDVIVSHDGKRFSSENDYIVYEIHCIKDASTVLVYWIDDGEDTKFLVTNCLNISDAFREIIYGMYLFLDTNDGSETDIWFHECCAGIDYDICIYRWNILSVPFN